MRFLLCFFVWPQPRTQAFVRACVAQELNSFYLQDFGIPYGYAPVLMANPAMLQAEPQTARRSCFAMEYHPPLILKRDFFEVTFTVRVAPGDRIPACGGKGL